MPRFAVYFMSSKEFCSDALFSMCLDVVPPVRVRNEGLCVMWFLFAVSMCVCRI